MFAVIYTFKLKENCEADFIAAWEGLTRLIYQYEGSLGSRLHKNADGNYLAYAQWPNKQRWEESGDKLPPEATEFSVAMRECCTEIKTLEQLQMINDLLQS